MNLQEIFDRFPTRKDCLDYLEKVRWNGDPKCPYCRSGRNTPMQDRHHCQTCHTTFRVTVGTIFHHTHLPLQKWFLALILLQNPRQRISGLQLSKDIEINKNTAWRIHRQIRKAMTQADQRQLLTRIVALDAADSGGPPELHSHN